MSRRRKNAPAVAHDVGPELAALVGSRAAAPAPDGPGALAALVGWPPPAAEPTTPPPAPAEGAAEPAPDLDTAPEPEPALSPAGEAEPEPEPAPAPDDAPALEPAPDEDAPSPDDDDDGANVVDLAARRRADEDARAAAAAERETELARLMTEWGIDRWRAEQAWERMGGGDTPPCPERLAVLPRLKPPAKNRAFWSAMTTPDNLRAVFELRPWRERLRWDAFALRVELRGAHPGSAWRAWDDAVDTPDVRADLSRDLLASWPAEDVRAYALGAARLTEWHPVREYLRGLRWDGLPRLWSWVPRFYGAPDTTLNREIGARWMISAVARVMRPGCKADSVLTLAGPQGCGKSRSLAALGGAWFADSPLAIGDKDGAQTIVGAWLWELAEMHSVQGRTLEAVKAYLSQSDDRYRPSYGRRGDVESIPRQTVFCATVNPETGGRFLADRTGNRRFWLVPVQRTPGAPVDVAGLEAERDQLWAEAFAMFEAGERWHLAPEQEAELVGAQEDAQGEIDPWAPLVGEWLSTRAPEHFTTAEAAEAAVKLDPSRLGQREARRLAACLHDAGCRGNVVRRRGGQPVKGWARPEGMGGEHTPEGEL